MTHRTATVRRPARRLTQLAVLILALSHIPLHSGTALAADLLPDSIRVGTAIGKFDNTSQVAVAYRLRSPRRLRAQYLDLAIGTLASSQQTRAFVSLGPVWRLPVFSDRAWVNAGFSPTLLSASSFDGRDMGGNFHFTSSAEIEIAFGNARALRMALRIQHTSNGGLSGTNPGMDIVGFSFSYNFGQ